MALLDELNGFESHWPSLPGALPPPRAGAHHLLAAALGMARQAREQEGEDQQQDAECDNGSNDHALADTQAGAGSVDQ